ncbi:nucleotidyltransferase family protein [Ruegeria sp. 2205SS24-7]|uniref:nucleotidyltransferase family protein n=1 Tax=Ruegeria discodermiae TaxID=3064389 RepID=UPI002741AE32|nr:nucleotidyltransferase family protein [Ruegeria sp. 2205SS24-7]MDP5219486.1 nucleotidyltransferase family protein [Ruegeria sp. 2205SS24-7]
MTNILLFAAGFGTRMGTLTQDRPKPLILVSGRALIDHTLDLAHAVNPGLIAANLHYKSDMLAAHLEPQGVTVNVEEPDILETGGGLRAALPLLGPAPVVTMNTDAIWSGPNPVSDLLNAWKPDRMDALLMCVPTEHALGHTGKGDFTRDEAGRITRGSGLIYGGVQILKTERLAEIDAEVFSLNRLWDLMLADKRLFALRYTGRWCDVGTPEGITLAETLLADV